MDDQELDRLINPNHFLNAQKFITAVSNDFPGVFAEVNTGDFISLEDKIIQSVRELDPTDHDNPQGWVPQILNEVSDHIDRNSADETVVLVFVPGNLGEEFEDLKVRLTAIAEKHGGRFRPPTAKLPGEEKLTTQSPSDEKQRETMFTYAFRDQDPQAE